MATREEQRKEILDYLETYLRNQAVEELYAIDYVDRNENDPAVKEAVERLQKTIKYGHWFPVYFLRKNIISAMEIEPIRDEGVDHTFGLRHGGYRTYHYSWLIYSEEDEAKVSTVIQRLNDQGYIKLSKSGKAFRVMKDKFGPVQIRDTNGKMITY